MSMAIQRPSVAATTKKLVENALNAEELVGSVGQVQFSYQQPFQYMMTRCDSDATTPPVHYTACTFHYHLRWETSGTVWTGLT